MKKKIKKHLRNFEAENSPKFKKHPGWPKNLVSYKKKNVYEIFFCGIRKQTYCIGIFFGILMSSIY